MPAHKIVIGQKEYDSQLCAPTGLMGYIFARSKTINSYGLEVMRFTKETM